MPKTGHRLAPEHDQPTLPVESVFYKGVQHQHAANVYAVWLGQRSQRYYQSLGQAHQAAVSELFGPGLLLDFISAPVNQTLLRVDNRFQISGEGIDTNTTT